MHNFPYFVVLHDGYSTHSNLINPRILTVDGSNRFLYDGRLPSHWRGEIARRHAITSPFDVMWLLGSPPVPSEDYSDEPDDCPSAFLADP